MAETKSLAEALAAFQLELPKLGKSSTADAGTYKYAYADLAEVSNVVLPLLAKFGLAFTTLPTVEDGRFVLVYRMLHAGSSETLTGSFPLPDKGSSQQMGSAITYARRYALSAVTGVAPDKDDDGAAAGEMRFEREREWDPIEQETLMTAWLEELRQAKNLDEISDIGRRVKRSGELSPASLDKLTVAAGTRKGELNGGGS